MTQTPLKPVTTSETLSAEELRKIHTGLGVEDVEHDIGGVVVERAVLVERPDKRPEGLVIGGSATRGRATLVSRAGCRETTQFGGACSDRQSSKKLIG